MKARRPAALPALLVSLLLSGALAAAVTVEVGKETGLKTWEWREDGVSLRLVQRLPDQTRAYLLARDLDQWEVHYQGRTMHMMTRERWKERLSQAGVSKAGRIAFNWSLMPTRQHFEPGDYNWGMTSYGLPPGSRFDLKLKLILGGKPLEALIEGLECAPEELRSPDRP